MITASNKKYRTRLIEYNPLNPYVHHMVFLILRRLNMYSTCEYVISAVSKKQYPNDQNFNEYVFLGRSNVGKSSFINALTNTKMLARTSSKPGKTQTINFFLINKKFYFVDVPGYGYATHSFSKREDFGNYIEEYLKDNPNLKMAFLLIDTKVGPTKDDILMFQFLKFLKIKITLISTKCDKIGTTMLFKHKKMIKQKLEINDNQIIFTSSLTKVGMDQVRDLIEPTNNNDEKVN